MSHVVNTRATWVNSAQATSSVGIRTEAGKAVWLGIPANRSKIPVKSEPWLKESLATAFREFNCDLDRSKTFESWYKLNEDIFLVDGASLFEAAKVNQAMQKLDHPEQTQYCNYILQSTHEISVLCEPLDAWRETLIFNVRYGLLQITILAEKVIVTYASRVSRKFKWLSMINLNH